ncbi:MAG: hypothetical protein LBU61_02440, partial [Coriobacteriales bacterium]|nr:hypothetical protein [Coriobacteriales bacterium]
ITINGGTITALGSISAAGIGGGAGYSHAESFGDGGNGGTITINGGVIYAQGGTGGAGIGGGMGGTDSSVCGTGGSGGTISINGGTIVATGGDGAAGIGGGNGGLGLLSKIAGNGGSGGTITVSGAHVFAVGGNGAPGVGGGQGGTGIYGTHGFGGDGGDITISGGTLEATGGSTAAGMGGGLGGEGFNGSGGGTGEGVEVTFISGTLIARGLSQALHATLINLPTGYRHWSSENYAYEPVGTSVEIFGAGNVSLGILDFGIPYQPNETDLYIKLTGELMAMAADATIEGYVDEALPSDQLAYLLICGDVLAYDFTDIMASAWFVDLPAGITVYASGTTGERIITLGFSDDPTYEGITVFDVSIPGSILSLATGIHVLDNPLAFFDIHAARETDQGGGTDSDEETDQNEVTAPDEEIVKGLTTTPVTGDSLLPFLVFILLSCGSGLILNQVSWRRQSRQDYLPH